MSELQIFNLLTGMLRAHLAELRQEMRDPASRDAGQSIVLTVIEIAAFAIATIAIVAIIVGKVRGKAESIPLE